MTEPPKSVLSPHASQQHSVVDLNVQDGPQMARLPRDKVDAQMPAHHTPSSSPQPSNNSPREDHGIRVEKRRRGGGFLLPSAFRHSSDNRHNKNSTNAKGKERAPKNRAESLRPETPSNGHAVNDSLRSSPLSQVVVNSRPSYGDGTNSRASTSADGRPSSEASSSRDGGSVGRTISEEVDMFDQHPPAIDPTQIVSMALNLSEGRRRHISAGQLLQQQGASPRRTSMGVPSPAMMQGSFQNAGPGGSLRQYLNQQRRMSRNQSPGSPGKTATGRHASAAHPPFVPDTTSNQQNLDYSYKFSQSTLARAEKARQYIELSYEYRRLLQYLPPLKPDASAPGNTVLSSSSVPGSVNVQLVRSPTNNTQREQYRLGRPYNPIQLIRNRKLRARTRGSLKPDVEQFSNVEVVRDWIDEVQDVSTRSGYRDEDKVHLPLYPDDGTLGFPDETGSFIPGHRRDDSTTKPKRSRSDWTFSPFEQLADAYWLEQGDNKRLIETRHNNKIFPQKQLPDALVGRKSVESRRSMQGSVTTSGSYEPLKADDDSPKDSARGRRHHLRRNHHDDDRGRLKHVWDKARGRSPSTSDSDLGISDDEASGLPKRKPRRVETHLENIGPLERHMDKMIGQGLHAQTQSPELVTPGTPNKWGLEPNLQRGQHHPSDSDNIAPDSDVRDHHGITKQPRHAAGNGKPVGHTGVWGDSKSSFEEVGSTGPNSPVLHAHVPQFGMDLSPNGSRAASPTRRLKMPLLPFIRENNKGHRKGQSHDFDADQAGSRQPSAEVTSAPRSSLEVPASPHRHRRLFKHRTQDSIGDMPDRAESPERDQKEPASAVKRFLKGGRIGDLVRGEGGKGSQHGRRRDTPQDGDEYAAHVDSDSMEESDTEASDANHTAGRDGAPPLLRSQTGSKRYHIERLPSFRPTNAKPSTKAPQTGNEEDHISKQQRVIKQQKPANKLDALAPPLDISRVTTASSNFADLSRMDTIESTDSRPTRRDAEGFAAINRNRSRLGGRLEAILDVPGGVGRGGLPINALAEASNQRPPDRPGLQGKRQWSISDKPRSRSRDTRHPAVDVVSIARVRALLTCTGIKAAGIVAHANEVHDPPPEWLREVARISNASLRKVRKSEEHVLAAKLLTTHLENENTALSHEIETFLSSTVLSLRKQLDTTTESVQQTIKSAQDLGDNCVGFSSEVTGQRTLQVRRVVDQLEKLARQRRRRLRWVRRVGFGIVEWGVVMVMWWIWFVVMIVRSMWCVVRGMGRGVKWVLWL